MISFKEYIGSLHERFLRGTVDKDGVYGEIYVNPTPSEMRLDEPAASWDVPPEFDGYGTAYYLGAWMTSRNLCVWSRRLFTHEVARRALPELRTDKPLPLYILYFPKKQTCELSLSNWSKSMYHYQTTDIRWLRLAATHPALRAFHLVTLDRRTREIIILKK